MDRDSLATYLHDHLAGADLAIKLLAEMSEHHANQSLAAFARDLLLEVRSDRDQLQQIVDEADAGPGVLKQVGAWVGEKVSRLKLGTAGTNDFRTFELLEFLALGVVGKLHLWRALQIASESYPHMKKHGFSNLIDRAEAQHRALEDRRLELARLL